jgi:death-on-curing protein
VKATPNDCVHLSVDIVKEIHTAVIAAFGGLDGIRDLGLLESAVAAPQATFGGQSPYADVAEVAAAYLFYLCRNHPFIDGYKRVGMTAAIVFLRLNRVEPAPDSADWEALMLDVAASRIDREQTTTRLKKLLKAKPKKVK